MFVGLATHKLSEVMVADAPADHDAGACAWIAIRHKPSR